MKLSRYAIVSLVVFAIAVLVAMPDSTEGQGKSPDTVLMRKGKSPLGGVKFNHKLHAELASTKCETCHHPSKPERPATAANQKCSDCHTMPAAKAPMKTNYQSAFHKPTGQAGLCVDCHKQENAKGKKAPVTCITCHKKENV